jgi:hypothetical protein
MDKRADQRAAVSETQAPGRRREPQKLSDARVLLPRIPPEHRALIAADPDGNLPVRIAVELADGEVVIRDGGPNHFAGGFEAVSAATGFNPIDQRHGEIEGQGGRSSARGFGHDGDGLNGYNDSGDGGAGVLHEAALSRNA